MVVQSRQSFTRGRLGLVREQPSVDHYRLPSEVGSVVGAEKTDGPGYVRRHTASTNGNCARPPAVVGIGLTPRRPGPRANINVPGGDADHSHTPGRQLGAERPREPDDAALSLLALDLVPLPGRVSNQPGVRDGGLGASSVIDVVNVDRMKPSVGD